jgi:transcriptional regulator with XRE-family HTH domain
MQNDALSKGAATPVVSYEKKVALTVRALRNFFGMSQSDLASLSGVSRPTLSSLEKGSSSRHANAETLEKLIGFFASLGVTINITSTDLSYQFSEEAVKAASDK